MTAPGRISSSETTRPRERSRTLSQFVVDDILQQIRDGAISVGDKLPSQLKLREIYDVGPSVVRDAMQQLAANGIVDVRPKRGATVVSIDPAAALDADLLHQLYDERSIQQLYSLRRLIEVDIAGQTAERAEPADIRRIVTAHEAFAAERNNLDVAPELDVAFHEAIALASENVVFTRVLDSVSDALLATRKQAVSIEGATEQAVIEHELILNAIRDGDVEAARAAMETHIDTAISVLRHNT